jgi:high-affinity nickel-transport protein
MIGPLSIIVLGFFLGVRHATDPDHVIAVTTIVARYKKVRDAALIGAFWGLGHTLTILAVGSGIILFGWVIPARVGLSMEFLVGLMLIVLGLMNLTGMLPWIAETFSPTDSISLAAHPHRHGHFKVHAHPDGSEQMPRVDRPFGRLGPYQILRPLVVGLVHGLAGSAAVALLVLATIQNSKWAVAYLLIFGTGTIAGMMLVTGATVLPFAYADRRFLRVNRGLRIASATISVGFGLFLVWEIGLVNGLLTSHPHWVPQ